MYAKLHNYSSTPSNIQGKIFYDSVKSDVEFSAIHVAYKLFRSHSHHSHQISWHENLHLIKLPILTHVLVFGTTSSHRCLATQQDKAHNTGVEESLLHLLLACPFAVRCWGTLHFQVGGLLDPFDILVSFKNQLAVPFFLELLVCMSWGIRTAQWPYLQESASNGAKVQVNFQRRVCRGYPPGKRAASTSTSFMTRSLCRILLIFFVSFFSFLDFVLGTLYLASNKS